MPDRSTAAAFRPAAEAQDIADPTDIRWLSRQSRFRVPGRLKRRRLLRASAAIALGAAAVLGSAGAALAPAAPAYAALAVAEQRHRAVAREWRAAAAEAGTTLAAIRLDPQSWFPERAPESRGIVPDLSDLEPPTGRAAGDSLRFGERRVSRGTVDLIARAAAATGVDPVFLMALADKESSFDAEARTSTSSAEGMFQFIERTWLQMVRDFGPAYGLADAARLIGTFDGRLIVSDPESRARILALRRDPYLAAVLAAEMMKRHRAEIAFGIGRDLTTAELYLPHFLGAGDAMKLLSLKSASPKANAVAAFPAAAKANRAIFYDRAGRKTRPSTVASVYERLDRMMDTRLVRFEPMMAYAGSDQAVMR